MRFLITAIALLLIGGPLAAKEVYVYGAPPDWQRYKQLGDEAVHQALPAGDWSVEWPNGFMKAGWHYHGSHDGYLTCGSVRTSSPPPGFYPLTNFAIVIDHDRVNVVEISSRASNSHVNVLCAVLVKRGMLPPPPTSEASLDLPVPSLGLTIRPMPQGAYVLSVASPSVGTDTSSGSKLAAGMVITQANGVPLAGMGAAMAALLGSDAAMLDLTTATGERITITRHR